jgi:hypothetical protein
LASPCRKRNRRAVGQSEIEKRCIKPSNMPTLRYLYTSVPEFTFKPL